MLVIKDVNLTLYGSIIARDQSKIVIENSILTLALTKPDEYNITIMDHATIEVLNSVVRSSSEEYWFSLYLFNETKAFFEAASFENSHEFYGSAEVTIRNSRVWWVLCYGSVVMNITDSVVELVLSATDEARVFMWKTEAAMLSALSSATIRAVDCRVGELGVTCYHHAKIWLTNVTSTTGGPISILVEKPERPDEAAVYVGWHVDILVRREGEPVADAEVEVLFQNGSLAGSGRTGPDGLVRLDLLQMIVKAEGAIYVGNYTIRASCGALVGEETISLTGNMGVPVDLLATLSITCLDGDEEPVEGVEVVLTSPEHPSLRLELPTAEDGTCAFTLLRPGFYSLRAYYMGVEVASVASIRITSIRLYALQLNCSIYDLRVLVRAPDGSPVGGAHIIIALLNGTQVAEATTNSSGVAILENLPATSYRLVIEAEGFKTAKLIVKLEREDQVAEVALEPLAAGPGIMPELVAAAVAGVLTVSAAIVSVRARARKRQAEEGEESS